MILLLDTHILLWWYLDSPDLPERYGTLLEQTKMRHEELAVSVMSLWEISKLADKKKIDLSFSLDEWFEKLEQDPFLQVLPLNSRIILEGTRLGPGFPRDPGDQLIAATARVHHLSLMTVDFGIINSRVVTIA